MLCGTEREPVNRELCQTVTSPNIASKATRMRENNRKSCFSITLLIIFEILSAVACVLLIITASFGQ